MTKSISKILAGIIILGLVAVVAGCGNQAKETGSDQKTNSNKLTHVVLANGGATCEAPVFVGIEKGFFKQEGLDVETSFMDFEKTKEGVATGKVDGVLGNLEWIKPIEQGMDVKYTTGVHTGCIQAVAPNGSNIKSVKDLKGKRIGVNAMGDYPMVLMSSALSDAGLDPKKDVEFKVYPGAQLAQALDKKEIDAFIMWDPFAQMVANEGKGHIFFSNTATSPYSEEYCCMLVLRGSLVKDDPATAAAITRAITKSALWVGQHPEEAAKIIIEKKYIAGDIGLTTQMIKQYGYRPSLEGGKASVLKLAKALKAQGILEQDTDPVALVNNAFVPVTEQVK
jgi:NitT/TauT family transport system substrate-binding protein